jgi:hypothetical protein
MHAPLDQAPVSTVAEAGCVKDIDGGPWVGSGPADGTPEATAIWGIPRPQLGRKRKFKFVLE